MEFTLMQTNNKRYVMLDNRRDQLPYDESLLCHKAREFRECYTCVDARGVLVLCPPSREGIDFSVAYYSHKGLRESVALDEALCALKFASFLEVPPQFHLFSTGEREIEYITEHSPITTLTIPCALPSQEEIRPVSFRYGAKKLRYYSLPLPKAHAVLPMELPEIFQPSEQLLLARYLAHDPARFPGGANITFIEDIRGKNLHILTYDFKEKSLTRDSSEGAVAAALLYAALHPGTEHVTINAPEGDTKVRFAPGDNAERSDRLIFSNSASYVSKGTVLPNKAVPLPQQLFT